MNSAKKSSKLENYTNKGQNMFDLIRRYLKRIEVQYRVLFNGKALDFAVNSPKGTWTCVLSLHKDIGLVFYSCFDKIVPTEYRTKMALFLTLLNNSSDFGNFEMDLKTGDVRFKTYVDCEGIELTEQMIEKTMLLNVKSMERYLPQLEKLLSA